MFGSKSRLFGFPLACLFLSASPILAQEAEVSLQDPSYLPSEGHLISDTGFSYERNMNRNYQADPFSGGLDYNYSYSSHSYAQSQSFQYGLVADLVIGIGESCSYRDETYRQYYYFEAYDFKDNSRGCNDPYVQAIYRGLSQSELPEFPVNIDLAATFAPNLLGATYGIINNAPGGAGGDVNVAFSRVFQDITLLGRIGASLNGRAKLAGGGFDSETVGAVALPYLELVSQYRPFDGLFLTGGVKAFPGYRQSETTTYPGAALYGIPGSVQETIVKGGYTVNPYVGAAWALIPDLLSASIRYQHGFAGNSRYYQDGALVGEFIDNSSDFVAIDFRVLWF